MKNAIASLILSGLVVMAIILHVQASGTPDMTTQQAVGYVVVKAKSHYLHNPGYAIYALREACVFWDDPANADLAGDAQNEMPFLRDVASHSLCKQRG